MGADSRHRKSFLPDLGWNVGSWDAQNKEVPWETFGKRWSQIVRTVGGCRVLGDLQSKATVTLSVLGLRERDTMRHHDH